MTSIERIDAIMALGFTRLSAGFLATVLVHGGYFVRRQFVVYAGIKHGRSDTYLVDRLVARRLATRLTYLARHSYVYHLCANSLYAGVNVPHRLHHHHPSQALIARKLMLLDFVLTEPHLDWYGTPAEKCDLFEHRFGLPESVFPRKTGKATRYWPHGLPMFLLGDPPAPHLVCLAVDPHASDVGTFVREHAPLLRHLPEWTLHAVMPPGVVIDGWCERAYERALDSVSMSEEPATDREWFARTRALVDAGDISSLSIADLGRYRELAARTGCGTEIRAAGHLVMHVLPYSYREFGSFPGRAC